MVQLPAGPLYFKTYAWGDMISQNKGKLLLLQRRGLVRREWRTVGTFKAEQIEDDGVAYDVVTNPMPMGAARVKEGDVLMPEDY